MADPLKHLGRAAYGLRPLREGLDIIHVVKKLLHGRMLMLVVYTHSNI
jgi:hypothetical protein